MENSSFLILALIVFEFFEFFWQKGENLKEYVNTLYIQYEKGVIPFACLHPSFFFILYCITNLNFHSFSVMSIAFMKCADIMLKISLLDKLKTKKDLGVWNDFLHQEFEMSPFLRALPMIFYVILFYIGINKNF